MNRSRSYHGDVSAWLRRNLIAASLIILFAATAPRVFLTWQADPSDVVVKDAVTYIRPAQSLIRQQAFLGKNGKPEVSRTPGYPVFLASIMILIGDDLALQENFTERMYKSMHPVLIVQAFILSIQVVVLYWLARRILPPMTAFMAGLLAAFSPWGAVHAGLPMTEGLFLLLLALIFFSMKITAEAENQLAVAVGGACTGLLTAATVLVRPMWPLVFLIGGVFFILYGPKRKGVWLLLFTTLTFAVMPLFLWKARNLQVGQFNGLTDTGGQCASFALVSAVNAHINNQDRWWELSDKTRQDRWALGAKARLEEASWKMSIEQVDQERWRRAKTVFGEHPVLTSFIFLRTSAEHLIHPSPFVLGPARLNFYGDSWVFALLWGGLLILAYLGWRHNADPQYDKGAIDRKWLTGLLIVCLFFPLSAGICFGGGSRMRAALELIVPLLAAVGLSRIVFRHSLRRLPRQA